MVGTLSPECPWLRGLRVLALVALLGSCAATDDEVAQNVVLITVDTLRADALGFAGNSRVETPNLDRLAADGRVFEEAHAHSTVTLPSHANILTGLYPYEHGVRDNLGFTLAEEQTTLAEILQQEGFATAAFVGAYPLEAEFGLDQGFDVYDDRLPVKNPGNPFLMDQRRGDEVVAAALEWWHDHDGQRRFLWVHLFEPHAPYLPPEPFAREYQKKPYLGEVAAVDSYLEPLIGPFLDGESAGETLIVFTSDHGEGLGEHDEATHGYFAYESTLKVPLVLYGPGVEPGRDRQPARHVDLVATVLDATGSEPAPRTAGRSLLAPVDDSQAPPPSYFESLTANLTRGWAPLRGMIQDRWKVIELPVPELYDLTPDPGEKNNLAPLQMDRYRSIAGTLPGRETLRADRGVVSSEAETRLRALGYLGGSAPEKGSYGVEDDLKNLIGLHRRLMRTHMQFTQGNYERAAALAASILEERPDLSRAHEYLAFSLLHLGRTPEAIAIMREAQRTGTAQLSLLRQLALTLTQMGQGAEAVVLLEEMIPPGAEPDPLTLNSMAMALVGAGRAEEAIPVANRVLTMEPENVAAFETLALASQALGQWEKARDYGLRATGIDGERADTWSNIGVAYTNLGDSEAALSAWARALEIAPDHVDALFNLGITAADLGQTERARQALVRFVEVAPVGGYGQEIEVARQTLGQMPR